MRKFVLATENQGKIREMRDILSEFGIQVLSRKEVGIDIHVEETGLTFEQNALLKAEAICKASGLPSIADDSGLEVDALDGEPGVYSSSYGGEHLNDTRRCDYLIKKMKNMEQRSAKFVCTIVCAYPDGRNITVKGECFGEIMTSLRGTGGFGYDPVFLVKGTDKSMAELAPEEKNALSHRGNALRALVKELREMI